MKKLFFVLAVFSMGLLTSCNKCKDKSCENGASCDKKSGDCSNVCKNGGASSASDGTCTCTEFYEGKTCADEVRANYYGTYSGSITANGNNLPSVVMVADSTEEATGLKLSVTVTIPGTSANKFVVMANLTDATNLEIVKTEINTSLGQGTKGELTGTGSFDGKKMTGKMNIKFLDGPITGSTIETTFNGSRP